MRSQSPSSLPPSLLLPPTTSNYSNYFLTLVNFHSFNPPPAIHSPCLPTHYHRLSSPHPHPLPPTITPLPQSLSLSYTLLHLFNSSLHAVTLSFLLFSSPNYLLHTSSCLFTGIIPGHLSSAWPSSILYLSSLIIFYSVYTPSFLYILIKSSYYHFSLFIPPSTGPSLPVKLHLISLNILYDLFSIDPTYDIYLLPFDSSFHTKSTVLCQSNFFHPSSSLLSCPSN